MLDTRGTGVRSRGGDNAILKYTGVLSDSVLLSAQAGRNEFDRTNFTDGDECPYVADDRGEVTQAPGCWVRSTRGSDTDTREAYRLDIDWFVGDHSLRAGGWHKVFIRAEAHFLAGPDFDANQVLAFVISRVAQQAGDRLASEGAVL